MNRRTASNITTLIWLGAGAVIVYFVNATGVSFDQLVEAVKNAGSAIAAMR